MNKKIVSLITGIAITTISTISFGTTGTVNTDNSRVRSEASSTSKIIDLLSINDKVEVLEEAGDWYKIKADKETGYISKDLLDVEEKTSDTKTVEVKETETKTEVEETAETKTEEEKTEESKNTETESTQTAENTNTTTLTESFVGNINTDLTIKILPSINSINITKIEKDSQITITEIINDWCHIETTTYSGWVRKNLLETSITSTATSSEEKEETKSEEATEEIVKEEEKTETKIGYVNVESVNLRKEKNTSSEILDGLEKNTKVTILDEEDGWYKVKVNDLTGYISKKYISDKKVEEVTSRAAESARQISETKQTEAQVSETKTVASTGSKGSDVVAYAKKYLGSKYVHGGASPSTGFDCSGFTSYVYSNFGVSLSRASTAQASNGSSVSKSELQPGDLLIFNNSSNSSVGHVGIYMGDGQFIHAANGSKGVITTSLSDSYYKTRYVDARRVL